MFLENRVFIVSYSVGQGISIVLPIIESAKLTAL